MTKIPSNIIALKNSSSVSLHARLLKPGMKYGLNMGLTHEGDDLIEFYEASSTHNNVQDGFNLGYFISRYYLTSISELDHGLDLCGYEPTYFASDANILAVKRAFC